MYSKKQRVISFLMAFLLIFTFAFINPLTMQKSDAYVFVPALTTNMSRIITGVLVSGGFVLKEIVNPTQLPIVSLQNISSFVYKMLDNAQKIALSLLSIIDNVVEVPVSLYNAIINKANTLIVDNVFNNLPIKYSTVEATGYPTISIPVYGIPAEDDVALQEQYEYGFNTYKQVEMTNAQPYFIYKGVDSDTNKWDISGIEYFAFDIFDDNYSLYEPTDSAGTRTYLTPDLRGYNITSPSDLKYSTIYLNSNDTYHGLYFGATASDGTTTDQSNFFRIPSDININDYIIYSYLLYHNYVNDQYTALVVTDFYDKETGAFVYQYIYNKTSNFIKYFVNSVNMKSVPYTSDVTVSPDTETITPPIINTAGDSVITLPSTLEGTIGITSTDVNVGSTDVPDVPNTETMENINTNVGELVTGGELGNQVSTNIGTVEGLHCEITSQVDFGAVFDTIAQYISALDISSVTWFPLAVASFLVPFLPVISLGIILFFIDRVLNGGA